MCCPYKVDEFQYCTSFFFNLQVCSTTIFLKNEDTNPNYQHSSSPELSIQSHNIV